MTDPGFFSTAYSNGYAYLIAPGGGGGGGATPVGAGGGGGGVYQQLASERDFLRDQVKRLESVVDAQEDTITQLRFGNRKKLSKRDVQIIRDTYSRGAFTQRELASMFDVNPATISRTVRGLYNRGK